MDTVSIFHPAVWRMVAVIVIPLISMIAGFVVYWLRKLDDRVLTLCQQVARLEGRLAAAAPQWGLHDHHPTFEHHREQHTREEGR